MALKWSDIDWASRKIHIHRMESLDEDKNGKLKVTICEYTKKKSPAGDRYLPLSDYGRGFIFCDEKGRTKIREVDNCIQK